MQEARAASKASEVAVEPKGAGMYAGFAQSRAKPPAVAQPPTPAETVVHRRKEVAEWAADPDVRAHTEAGGRSFAADDYLDLAPAVGPAAGGDWRLPVESKAEGAAASPVERDARTGRFAKGSLTRAQLDAMPIELLMRSELSNERGLKWRMRRWKEEQAAGAEARRASVRAQNEAMRAFKQMSL